MEKIEKYENVSRLSLEDLDLAVKRRIEMGWQPVGGVQITITTTWKFTYYIQTMVKYEKN